MTMPGRSGDSACKFNFFRQWKHLIVPLKPRTKSPPMPLPRYQPWWPKTCYAKIQ